MGYDIVSGRSKKEMDSSYDNILSHIQCQYAYQQYFREAFGCEIRDWSGRLCKKDIPKFTEGIDNFIHILEKGVDVPMYRGNLANCSQSTLIKEMLELKTLVQEGKIRYMRIS